MMRLNDIAKKTKMRTLRRKVSPEKKKSSRKLIEYRDKVVIKVQKELVTSLHQEVKLLQTKSQHGSLQLTAE